MVRFPDIYYCWEWALQSPPEALWPLVSDTNHFNRDAGIPQVEDLRPPGMDLDNARRNLRVVLMGVPVEWEEEPFEWVRPARFGVVRRYRTGPMAMMRTCAELMPLPNGGTRLIYQVWAQPRTLLGLLAIPAQVGVMSRRRFGAAFQRYDRMVQNKQSLSQATGQVRFAPGGQMRMNELGRALVEKGLPPGLAARLVDLVAHGDDVAVAHLRPYVLADTWGEPRRAVLELFLWATRLGLVDFQWELLCPLCRGVKQAGSSLREVQPKMHCEVCRIDFDVNFDRSVELTFRPNPGIRPIDVGEYCIGGPQVTPHIVAQQLLVAGAERELTLPLEPGRYRLRTLGLPGGQLFVVSGDGSTASVTLCASDDGWPEGETSLALMPLLRLRNETRREQLFIFEHMAWSDQAVTAAEVTSLQLFRDLFANEALRPDAQISVGSLTVLFTDLRDSTRLYREIGDAVAFGRVMGHFDVLREAVVAEDGTLVKTIGDSVMAVFRRPLAALHAILDAQEALTKRTLGSSLVLKAGIHHGPCIAVTLNDRLDYFGSTVNIAARVQNLSEGDDVVITSAVRDDPEVRQWLAEQGGVLTLQPFEAKLKGVEDHFYLWRITRPIQHEDAKTPGH